MAYDKDEIEKEAINILENENVTSITALLSFLECSKQWFYDNKMYKLDSIKKGIKKNVIAAKEQMKNKWFESQNATLNIAWYKLNATKDEYERLNGTKFRDQTDNGSGKPIKVVIENKTKNLDD